MTKHLEALLNLPSVETTPAEAETFFTKNREIIQQVDEAIDKIDAALPGVRDLDTGDDELDELSELAKEKFTDMVDLGMNTDPRFAGVILQTASTLLGHAITAKTAKLDKKIRMVQLQLQKARLDHQIKKDAGTPEEQAIEGQGVVLDRNALLAQILAGQKK
jgi:hypothetical protein